MGTKSEKNNHNESPEFRNPTTKKWAEPKNNEKEGENPIFCEFLSRKWTELRTLNQQKADFRRQIQIFPVDFERFESKVGGAY